MYKNCKLILTNYYYKSITNTLALQRNKKHVRTLLVIKTNDAIAQLKNCLSVFDHFVGLVLKGQKPMLQSFRAQSLHLQLKSIDWFLHDRNISQYKC